MEEQNHKSNGALDAFLNLFSLITLGWMSISIGLILFQIIDKFFSPQKVDFYNQFSQSGLKFGVASALIITPIFLMVIGSLHKHYKNNELNPQSGIYRWLTYLVLLITAINIIGRLIQLVFQFLEGEYTLASVLKILVVLLIAGGIFGYYWYDLKRNDYSSRSMFSQIFMWLIIVISLSSIIGAILIIDSPVKTRERKNDEQRVNHLNMIKGIVSSIYVENGELPTDLSTPRFSQIVDPDTGEKYEYSVIDETKYKICATFNSSAQEWENNRYFSGEDWDFHEAGYQCFEQSVSQFDKSIPVPKVIR